jgi:glyoxylase-like metal-dependent hydrolase (beta-lactamase superfamily II)
MTGVPLRTLRIGEHRLTYLPDGLVQLDPDDWFPGITAAERSELDPYLDEEGFIAASIGALLVRYRDRALLIDSGFGSARIPAGETIPPLGRIEGGGLPASLAAAGQSFGSIEAVAFTHLHDDHVGWAFHDEGLLSSRARFLASGPEWLDWARPVPDGRSASIKDSEEIFPGVTVSASPGHSDGHLSYVITASGTRVIAFGDVLHSPAQIAWPAQRAFSDADTASAQRSRRELVRELAVPGTFGFGGHFGDAVFGRLTHGRWSPVS